MPKAIARKNKKISRREGFAKAPPPPYGWIFIVVAVFLWCFWQTGLFRQEVFNPDGLPLLLQFWQAGLHPRLDPEFLQLTAKAAIATLSFAVCGTTVSLALGTVGGVFASQVWWQSVGGKPRSWLLVRALLAVPRGAHELVWALFWVNIFGFDPLVAILAIALPFGAIVAKVFSEILDDTPRESFQALLAAGAPPFAALLYGLLPAALPNLISYAFYRFECSIRSAATVGIIGAGGLGYELYLSEKSHHYAEMWTFFWALVLLNGAIDVWGASLRRCLGVPGRLEIDKFSGRRGASNVVSSRETVRDREVPCGDMGVYPPDSPCKGGSGGMKRGCSRILYWFSAIAIVTIVPVCFWYVGADFSKFWQMETWTRFGEVFQKALPPDFSQAAELFGLAGQTLAMSVLAMAASGAIATFLAFFAAARSERRGLRSAIAGFVRLLLFVVLLVARAIPPPIWALVLLYVFFPGILPGAIALAAYNLGVLGRLMAEAIENLDDRPTRALLALGATEGNAFLYGTLPRTLPRFLAYTFYRWETCIRATAIVGLVGAGSLGRVLTEQISSFDYDGVATTLVFFIALTGLVDWTSARVRQALK